MPTQQQTTYTAPKAITLDRVLTEDFFSLVGLDDMSKKEKDEMLQTMNETIQARVFYEITQKLSPEENKEFDSLPAEEMITYLNKKGFDVPVLIFEEALKYRLELATLLQMSTTPSDKIGE